MIDINSLDQEQIKLLNVYNIIKNNEKLKQLAENVENSQDNHLVKCLEQEVKDTIKNILNIDDSNNPKEKKIRIFIDGVFDIIHSGHFNAIRQAKRLGDYLVVGINSDFEKAKGPTLMNAKERAALVGACKWVDEVIIDTPYTPTLELLDELNIDYCAHGDDPCFNENGDDVYAEMKKKNRFKTFKRTEGISTTEIIGRLLMVNKTHSRKSSNEKNDIITSSSLLQKVNEENFEKGPVVSSFLTTGWRLREFCNNRSPKQNDKIVYIDGAFDILHIGHIETLKKAKELGDFLYVGVHDDATVNNHRGKNYPILNLQERVINLLALKYVDDVIIAAPWIITEDLIKSMKIDLIVQGSNNKFDSEYLLEHDPYEVPKKLNIYQQIESSYDLTSEILVQRLILRRENYMKKYMKKITKEKEYYDNKEYLNEI